MGMANSSFVSNLLQFFNIAKASVDDVVFLHYARRYGFKTTLKTGATVSMGLRRCDQRYAGTNQLTLRTQSGRSDIAKRIRCSRRKC